MALRKWILGSLIAVFIGLLILRPAHLLMLATLVMLLCVLPVIGSSPRK